MSSLPHSGKYSNSLTYECYEEDDIEHMDRMSSHPTRETTLSMFWSQINMAQQDTAATSATASSRISGQKGAEAQSPSTAASTTIPHHSSLSLPTLSSSLPTRACSMTTSSHDRQQPRLRRSTTNFYNRCQQPASVIPRHQTILEAEDDNYDEEETNTYKDNIELSKTEVSFPLLSPVPSLNRRVSTTTIRTNETLRSYGTESTMPTTMSNILSEKPNEDIILSTDSLSSEEKVLVDHDKNKPFHQGVSRTTLEKGKWIEDRLFTPDHESESIPCMPENNNVQELIIPWLTTLQQYIEQSQNEILTKEKELLELCNELKLLEKVQAQAQQKIQLDHCKESHNDGKLKKSHDQQANNKERSKERLLLSSLRKQAVHCINTIASTIITTDSAISPVN